MQRPATMLTRGGLDTASPPIAAPAGSLSFCENYEPDVAGYTRFAGYERFDGRDKPSGAANATDREARRSAIGVVPGKGDVLAAWSVTDEAGNSHYAIRENAGNTQATLYRASSSGWTAITPNSILYFNIGAGSEGAPLEGEWVRLNGGPSGGGVAKIERVVHLSGTYSGADAFGYFCLSSYTGDFDLGSESVLEFSTDNSFSGGPLYSSAEKTAEIWQSYGMVTGMDEGTEFSSGAVKSTFQPPINVSTSVTVRTHLFTAGGQKERSYFTTGGRFAFEFDGSILCPIRTPGPTTGAEIGGNLQGLTEEQAISQKLITGFKGIEAYAGHLFFSTRAGTLINSAPNDPLDLKAISGASEIGFGTDIVGLQGEVSGALIVYGGDRVSYLTGSSSADFTLRSILKDATPRAKTMQLAGSPIFMDRTGVRRLTTTEEFGNWRVSTLTARYESFFKTAFSDDVSPVASQRINERDIYRLFFDSGVAITVYFGRQGVEIGRLKLPINVTTASGASSAQTDSVRLVGADNGYVYQMDIGNSMDGDPIEATFTLNPYVANSPRQEKRFATADVETVGGLISSMRFAAEYNYSDSSQMISRVGPLAAGAGGAFWGEVYWSDFVWPGSTIGTAIAHLDGFGRNIIMAITTSSDFEEPHTITAITFNCMYRGVVRR